MIDSCARYLLAFLLLAGLGSAWCQQAPLPYRDPTLPIDARVEDLLTRMTVEEKVAQLQSTWQNHGQDLGPKGFFIDDKGNLDEAKAAEVFKNGLGQMSRPSEN